ncbi:MAG: type VI secretion system baseplate subunit TssG [Polaromonas sp.]|nr:type VI secretion system baseplate subunit TssG [Polaromonas sp.]
MGTDERPPAGALVERLVSRPQGFNLFQAISLLERASPNLAPVGSGDGKPESVRLSSVVSLGFQPSDVSRVNAASDEGEAHTLFTAVMSLAGAQGPLPLPFTELVLERTAARDHATADFLNIFNHRFLAFLYRSRKKHHMGLNWQSAQSSALASCLDSLSALGLKAGVRAPQGESAWIRHAGLLGGAPRSMTGLLAMLSDRLGVKARGLQFRGGWRDLEPRDIAKLSARQPVRGPRLGRSAVLGKRVWDQSAGVLIELSSLSLPQLRRLLKGGEQHELMKWMVRRYLQQDVGVEFALQPDIKGIRQSVLGGHESPLRLGWTSWLVGSTPYSGTVPPARFKLQDDGAQAAL